MSESDIESEVGGGKERNEMVLAKDLTMTEKEKKQWSSYTDPFKETLSLEPDEIRVWRKYRVFDVKD